MTQHAVLDLEPARPVVLRRHPLAVFLGSTFALSWALWAPLVVLGDRMPAGPGLLLVLLGSAVPSTVGILMVAWLNGQAEVRRLLRRLRRGRVGISWYAAIVALSVLPLCAVWVSIALGATAPVVAVTLPGIISFYVFSIFPGSAMGEELGWRGFVLPRLQATRSALGASLILGAFWGAFHFPLFLVGSAQRPLGLFAPFALSTIIMSIFYTWMYNGTRGSLLMIVLLHATTNLPVTIVYAPLEGRVVSVFWILDAIQAVAAVALIARVGPATLSRSGEKQASSLPA
jgi:membrane protease YdiL (CAAX protease family)